MATRVVLDCDNCGSEGAETVGPVDVGHGARTIDLCGDCQEIVGIPKLRLLLTDYGVNVGSQVYMRPAANGIDFTCPVCTKRKTGSRGSHLVHMRDVHKMTMADASRACPPVGPSKDCPECGFVMDATHTGPHLATHRRD